MAKATRANIVDVDAPHLQWVHLRASGQEELAVLRRRFLLREDDLRDVPPPTQRPKIVFRENYVFFILLFPYFDKARQEILMSEVDFFIGHNFLVTVNDGDHVAVLNNAVSRTYRSRPGNGRLNGQDASALAMALLDEMISSLFPMLIHMSEDIDTAESALFDENERHSEDTISRLLRIKTNITGFRRAVMGHKHVIDHLQGDALPEVVRIDPTVVRRLVDMTKEIWSLLENHRETISALHDTHVSLLSFRTNQIMRTLTIFSVIVFPLTLLAAIFGMNTASMPVVGHPYGFWIIVGLMLLGVVGMIAFFKEKRWL